MKCPEAVRLLDGHVDEQLDMASVIPLEDHLRECSRCRAREESLLALRSTVRRHTEYRIAPEVLRASLLARFGAGIVPLASRRRIAVGSAALAALGLAALSWQAGFEWAGTRVARGEGKVVYHIADSRTASAALRTLRNHLEASPRTKVVVVAHNEGVDFLLRGARDESGQLYEIAVRPFKDRGVDFRVCTNTLVRRKIEKAGIVPEATLVPSGIAEIGRLQETEGYAYMRM
jgi:intracellular sulfur oxidation DsrE/DsrF family protein